MQRARRPSSQEVLSSALLVALVVATLYFAQEVLIPLALAVLLAFLLAPLARRLERIGLSRIPAVVTVVGTAFAVIVGLGMVVGRQVTRLAEDLPKYQDEIVTKIERFRSSSSSLGKKIERFTEKIDKAATETVEGHQPPTPLGSTPANPLFTRVLPPPAAAISTLTSNLHLFLSPLGTAGFVVLFVIFILIQREDLRDRMIRIISRGQYTVTTKALNDAGTRISRYILAQTIVNGTYGLVIGTGLWLIGLTLGGGVPFPNFVLWGLLCAVLRFIPFLGPLIGASFPVLLALGVYPGLTVFGAVLALLLGIELICNNVMEPWLYGSRTGMSNVAIIVAAIFWTWLWGPVGLLLSTPLTVCIVVIGKYVPQLEMLDILLGDQPALAPSITFYQRLLANDRLEAAGIAKKVVEEVGIAEMADSVLIPALRMARRDRNAEELSSEREAIVLEEMHTTLRELAPAGSVDNAKDQSSLPAADHLPLVLGCPAHHLAEEIVLDAIGQALGSEVARLEIASTRLLPSEIEDRIAQQKPALVLIAIVPPSGLVQARYLCRRLRRKFRDLNLVVGYYGPTRDFDGLLVRLRTAGANHVTTSVEQTRAQLLTLLPAPPAERTDDEASAQAAPVNPTPGATTVRTAP